MDMPLDLKNEVIETISSCGNVTIERIISKNHSTPKNKWYDQETDEFVILLSGSANLMFENDEAIILEPGDYIFIPAHKKHRVSKTDPDLESVWLAVHIRKIN